MKEILSRSAMENAVLLSDQELDIVRMIGKGYSNKKIGEAIGRGERTVGTHIHKLLGQMGEDDRIRLV